MFRHYRVIYRELAFITLPIHINVFLVYSMSGCCYSGVLAFSVVSLDFDAEVFWRQLFHFHNIFNRMAALVFSNFILMFLWLLQIFSCWATIILTL